MKQVAQFDIQANKRAYKHWLTGGAQIGTDRCRNEFKFYGMQRWNGPDSKSLALLVIQELEILSTNDG